MTQAGGAEVTSYALYIDDGRGGDFYQVEKTKPTYTLNSVVVDSGI